MHELISLFAMDILDFHLLLLLFLFSLFQPVMDGIEATKRIRAISSRKLLSGQRLCIIGMSANGDKETAKEGLAAGMDAFFEKPCSMRDVMRIALGFVAQQVADGI